MSWRIGLCACVDDDAAAAARQHGAKQLGLGHLSLTTTKQSHLPLLFSHSRPCFVLFFCASLKKKESQVIKTITSCCL